MLSQLKKTLENSVFYTFGNVLGKLSGIILLPLYAKFLPIGDYGILALLEIAYLLINQLSAFGLKAAMIRWYWDKDYNNMQKSIFFTILIINIVVSLVLCLVLYFVLNNYSEIIFTQELSSNIISLFLFNAFFKIIVDLTLLLLRIQQKALKQTIYQTGVLVITITLTVYFVAFRGMRLDGILSAQLVSHVIIFLFLLLYIVKNIKIRFELTILKSMYQYGIPLFLASLSTTLLVLTDRYIISIFKTVQDVGQYSLAFKISNLVQVVFVTSFMNSFVHIFYKNMDEKNSSYFSSKVFTYFVFVIVIIGLTILFFSKEIIYILSNENQQYYNSYKIIPYLIIGAIFNGMQAQLMLPLSKEKRTKLISLVLISSTFLNFGLNMVLIPLYSSIGAAISTAISQLMIVIVFFIINKKYHLVNYEYSKILKCLVLGISLFVISLFFNQTSSLIYNLIKILLLFLYFFLLYHFNFFSPIELDSIKAIWVKWKSPINWKENLKKN